MGNRELDYIDITKVLLTFFVLLSHILKMFTSKGAFLLGDSLVCNYLTNFFYSFQIPLFFFVSGYVYNITYSRYDSLKIFYIKKIKRLIIPYLFWGMVIWPPLVVLLKINTFHSVYEYVWNGIILGYDSKHLWFLLSLFITFLLFSFIQIKRINNLALLSISIILFILSFFVPSIFQISHSCYYQLFFVIGFLYKEKEVNIKKIHFLIILQCIILHIVFVKFSFSNSLINKLKELLCAFLGIIDTLYISFFLSFKIKNRFINYLYDNSMGIYIIHPFILYIISYYLQNFSISNYFIIIISMLLFIVVVSIAICELIGRINLGFLLGNSRKKHDKKID